MYLVKENFQAKKDAKSGKAIVHKVGETFSGEGYEKEEIAAFKKDGLIVEEAKANAALLSELEKKVEAAKAELLGLQEKCKTQMQKLQPQSESSGKKN